MGTKVGLTGITFGDATVQNTAAVTGVTSAVAGSGISVSGSTGAVTFTNSGVTSLTAGSGISVSGSTGAVTVSATGGGTVTSVSGTNGLTGTVTTSGSLSLDVYTGSTKGNTSYPIGTNLILGNAQAGGTAVKLASSSPLWVYTGGCACQGNYVYSGQVGGGYSQLAGTWRGRGAVVTNTCPPTAFTLMQRTA